MCGITGFISYDSKVNIKSFYNAHLKIAHRGPDDEGFMVKIGHEFKPFLGNDSNKNLSGDHIESIDESSVILGHRRLSILDLSTKGHQPYKFEQYWLTYNGEIYNYLELRDELIKHGYSFESNSDTEVFIKGYHYWGNDLFEKLNGMWAAAIFNENDESVTLIRDRFGIKPLYYACIDGQLVFGSEIKFVASFFNELNVNEQAVIDYVSSCYIDHSNETFFKDIFQLLPGCFSTYSKGTPLKFTKYWKIKENNVDINQVNSVLTNAIEFLSSYFKYSLNAVWATIISCRFFNAFTPSLYFIGFLVPRYTLPRFPETLLIFNASAIKRRIVIFKVFITIFTIDICVFRDK